MKNQLEAGGKILEILSIILNFMDENYIYNRFTQRKLWASPMSLLKDAN